MLADCRTLLAEPAWLRQRRLFEETGSLRAVVAALAAELERDLASPQPARRSSYTP